MVDFQLIVLSALAAVLWVPTVLCILVKKRRLGEAVSNLFWLVLPLQLIATIALIALAEFIGLLNPIGYILGITVSVSIAGALLVCLTQRLPNPPFKQDSNRSPLI